MKRYLLVALAGLVFVALGVAGCQDLNHYTYSSEVRYGVRTDPMMIASQPGQLGDEVFEPDRPGVFPLSKPQDVLVPENPMYAKGMDLFKQGLLRDPTLIPAEARQKLDNVLTDLFGTPAEPRVAELEPAARKTLGLDDATLREGSRHYRVHCVHCHGVSGDGHGPTARWISPHPRDFRPGLFKFMSVDQTSSPERPPRRGDLYRTIRSGIEGTAMPSFLMLDHQELEDLVSYVIHLSLRGKAEFITLKSAFNYRWDEGKGSFAVSQEGDDLATQVKENHADNVAKWLESQDPKAMIEIPARYDPKKSGGAEDKLWRGKSDEQIAQIKGAMAQALFNNEEPALAEARQILEIRKDKPANVNCKQCHTDLGRQAKFRFDSWGTLVRPNNFVVGVFRGGRRPADIYHRIHSGINGSGMTPFGKTLSPNSMWDMVDYVQALSYPAMRGRMGVVID